MKLKRYANFINESDSDFIMLHFEVDLECDQCDGEGTAYDGLPCICSGITRDDWYFDYTVGKGVTHKRIEHVDDFGEIEFIENFINDNKHMSNTEMSDALMMLIHNDGIENSSTGVKNIKLVGDALNLISDKVKNIIKSDKGINKYDL